MNDRQAMRPIADLSKELLLIHHESGIKIIRPENTTHDGTVIKPLGELMPENFNIFFHNLNHEIEDLNEACAHSCGIDNKQDIIGKPITTTCTNQEQAQQIDTNNEQTIHSRHLNVYEENVKLIHDKNINAISYKMPWYDQNNEVIGVFGCAILIEDGNVGLITQQLAAITRLFFRTKTQSNKLLPGKDIRGIYFSTREMDVIRWLIRGKSAREIGSMLNLSSRTVESYIDNMKNKAGLTSKAELIEYIVDHLITL